MRFPLGLVLLLGFGLQLSADEPATKSPDASTKGEIRLIVPAPTAAESEETWDPKIPAPAEIRTSFVHRLAHAPAAKVAAQVSQALQQVHCLDGTKSGLVIDSPVVIVPDSASNCLIVAASAQYIDEIKEQIAKADAEPRHLKVNIRLKTTDDNGEQYISSPQIMTLEGSPATISVKDASGVGYELQVEVNDVTASSIGALAPAVADEESDEEGPAIIPTSGTKQECSQSESPRLECPRINYTVSSTWRTEECAISTCDTNRCKSTEKGECTAAAKSATASDAKCPLCERTRVGCTVSLTTNAEECPACANSCPPARSQAAVEGKPSECPCEQDAGNYERIGIDFDFNTGETCPSSDCPCLEVAADECKIAECIALIRFLEKACCPEACSSTADRTACPCEKAANKLAAHSATKCPCRLSSNCDATCAAATCECQCAAASKCATAACECPCSASAKCSACTREICASDDCACENCAGCEACLACKGCPAAKLAICQATQCPHCGTGIEITVREISATKHSAHAVKAPRAAGCDGCKCKARSKKESVKQPNDASAGIGCPYRGGIECLIAGLDSPQYRPAPLHECEDPSSDLCKTEVQRVGHRLFQDNTDEDEVVPASIQRHVVAPMIAMVYSVADLVTATDGGEPLMTPEQLVELIQRTIAAESWEQNGGPAGVEFFSTTLSLVVRQDRATQAEISSLIGTLRELQQLKSCDVNQQRRTHSVRKPVEVE